MTLGEVAPAIRPARAAVIANPDAPLGRVTTDSREVGPGDFFVALRGEKLDGADFVEEAFRRGASAALVDAEGAGKVPEAVRAARPVFVVRDAVAALGDLAFAHRRRFRGIPLVGITGSSGKTSTKEMLAALLSRTKTVLRNPGNRNNLIGMPLALLELSEEHDAAIMEMGTNRPGEIARLAEIAAPDVGIVTNVAPAHLEGLGTLEGVARETGDLYRALPASGTAVVNATDLRVVREAGRCRARKYFYGVMLNDFSGRIVEMGDTGMRLVVRTPEGEFSSHLPLTGEHQLWNALAAVAAAWALGLRLPDLEEGFAGTCNAGGRFRTAILRGGGLLIDDTYNANPASVEAALRSLKSLRRDRRTVAVLADMLELGEASPASHFRIGHLLAGMGVDLLFTFGEMAAHIGRGAREGGMPPVSIVHTDDRRALRDAVLAAVRSNDVVLVKGSRGMRLDEVAQAIEKERA